MFSALAQPLIYFINFLEGFTGSYAISVMIITLLVRLALFPLFVKSSKHQKNAKAFMDKVKPELEQLQEKIKQENDPQKKMQHQLEMQQLSMDSMKSTMLGCLPMLVQFPILVSLYTAIKIDTAIGAENFLWMNLGTASLWMSLIAAVIYFLQGRIGIDLKQNPQMKWMLFVSPVMIFIFSIVNPAILPIYWATSAVLLILQQMIIKKVYV
jgi:YidC/Oxa1 family membrane protein insertase